MGVKIRVRQVPFNLSDETPSTEGIAHTQAKPSEARTPLLPSCDLHTHTVHCGHADPEATVLNILARASERQLRHFGISEHVMRAADVSCIEVIREEMRSAPATEVQHLLGVEMDIDPTDRDGHWVVPDIQCDYVILSAHALPQFDWDNDLAPKLQRNRLSRRWLGWFGNAVRRGGFTIIGHPLREPIAMNLIDLSDPETMELAFETFLPAIDQQIAFELNDAFMTALRPSIHFSGYLELLERLRDKGMKFSRGADSHSVLRVGACNGIAHVAREIGLEPSDWFDASSITPRSL